MPPLEETEEAEQGPLTRSEQAKKSVRKIKTLSKNGEEKKQTESTIGDGLKIMTPNQLLKDYHFY